MKMNEFDDQMGGQNRKMSGNMTGGHDQHGHNNHNHSGGISSASRSGPIGQALKSVYQQTVEEDLPEDFQKLLDQLK